MKRDNIPIYIGMSRLCELIDMSDDTVRRKIKTAGFPKPKPSGKWKWSEVEAWMDAPTNKAVPSASPEDQTEEIKHASAAYFATHH